MPPRTHVVNRLDKSLLSHILAAIIKAISDVNRKFAEGTGDEQRRDLHFDEARDESHDPSRRASCDGR